MCGGFVMACHQKLAQYTLFCLCTYVIKFLQNNAHENLKNFDKFNFTNTTEGEYFKNSCELHCLDLLFNASA